MSNVMPQGKLSNMHIAKAIAIAALTSCVGLHSNGVAQQQPRSHDGRWSVGLACPDVKDKSGLVKGYEHNFVATISGGQLEGQYGASGAPSSLSYSGHVQEDGTLEIKAVGHTGNSEFSVGRVAQGTQYSYTMSGKLGLSHGQAARREGRPCIATFVKQ